MEMKELLKILACPACHGDLELLERDGKSAAFYCQACDRVYPIKDDIPIMLISSSMPLAKWQEK